MTHYKSSSSLKPATTPATMTTPRVNSRDLDSESLSTITQEHINRFIGRNKHDHRISKHNENDGEETINVSGHCEFCTKAQITTMEPHFGVSPHIGEFWSTITSITYHLIFLLLFIPYTSWWQPWQDDKCLPKTLLITIYLSVITGFVSFIYHMFLWDGGWMYRLCICNDSMDIDVTCSNQCKNRDILNQSNCFNINIYYFLEKVDNDCRTCMYCCITNYRVSRNEGGHWIFEDSNIIDFPGFSLFFI